nr:hypothetical protein [Tanacetum cinerariifolium]
NGTNLDDEQTPTRHQNGYANVMWLIAKWLKRRKVGSKRDIIICCGQFITRMAKRMNLLTDEVLHRLSALVFCRALDAITLRELIESNKRLIIKNLVLDVLRIAMPRPPRSTITDLYDKMDRMEIR